MRAMPERQARCSMNVRRPSPTSLSGCGYAPIADVWGWPPLITTLKATPTFTSIARGQQARFTPSVLRYVQGGAQVVAVSHARRSWQARQTIEAANQKSRTTRAIRDACQRLGARPPLTGSHFAIFQKQRPRHEGCAPGARHLHLAGRRRTRMYSQRQPCAVSNWYATHGRIIAHLEGDDLKHPPERTADAARGHKVSGIGSRGHR